MGNSNRCVENCLVVDASCSWTKTLGWTDVGNRLVLQCYPIKHSPMALVPFWNWIGWAEGRKSLGCHREALRAIDFSGVFSTYPPYVLHPPQGNSNRCVENCLVVDASCSWTKTLGWTDVGNRLVLQCYPIKHSPMALVPFWNWIGWAEGRKSLGCHREALRAIDFSGVFSTYPPYVLHLFCVT